MTVKQLRKAMRGLDPNMDVFIEKENGDFSLALVERAKVKNCEFREDSGSLKAKVKCLVITDEY